MTQTNSPNVLILMADQLRHDCVGYAQKNPVITPNIDELAKVSHQFTSCFVPAPYCVPSRAALFTGSYPHVNGILTNTAQQPVKGTLLHDSLSKSGYQTILSGKRHVHSPTLEDLNDTPSQDLEKYAKRKPLTTPLGNSSLWSKPNNKEITHSVDRVARQSIDFFETCSNNNSSPFFLWSSWVEPHAQGDGFGEANLDSFNAPEGRQWDEIFDRSMMPLPQRNPNEFSNKPQKLCENIQNWHSPENDEEIQEATARYYGTIAMLDKHIGRVLKSLKDAGLWDNTLIIFMSDHGEFMGEHSLYRKRNCLYDSITRIPLLVKLPNQLSSSVHDGFVEEIDITQTIYDVCGAEAPTSAQGQSLLPKINGQEPFRDHVFGEIGLDDMHIQSIRTKNYLYIEWPEEPGELYNLQKDPWQLDNKFSDPTYSDEKASLKRTLDQWRQKT